MSEIFEKISRGDIDINNSQQFLSTVIKSFISNLNGQIKLHNKTVPHFILNTGDDIMYLENKGQNNAIEPGTVSNEDYIYNSIPRCILDVKSIEVLEDQITSPYTRGYFEISDEDTIQNFNAEFRRIPLKLSIDLKYYLDSFSDVMNITQKVISKMLFIRVFNFDYLGQTIQASYKVPTSYDHEKDIAFDGGSTEQKVRTISLSIDIETNMPVFDEKTVILSDEFIKTYLYNIKTSSNDIIKSTY